MNRFAGLPLDEEEETQEQDEEETQEQVLAVVSFTTEEDDSKAVESLDEGGEPFEISKHERKKERKTAFNIKNKELNLAKQKRMEAWQLAEKQRISQAQSKLIEFENNAKKGISVSLTENYTDIILKLLHIIYKDKSLSEIEIICKTFIEKLENYWDENYWNEMEEDDDDYMNPYGSHKCSGGWCYNEFCECNT
jgi:hypothetical protein